MLCQQNVKGQWKQIISSTKKAPKGVDLYLKKDIINL